MQSITKSSASKGTPGASFGARERLGERRQWKHTWTNHLHPEVPYFLRTVSAHSSDRSLITDDEDRLRLLIPWSLFTDHALFSKSVHNFNLGGAYSFMSAIARIILLRI